MTSKTRRVTAAAAFASVLCYGAQTEAAIAPPTPVPSGEIATAKAMPACTGLCPSAWTKLITIGAGLPALSVRFDGKLGFADRVAPFELGVNMLQYEYIPSDTQSAYGQTRFCFWRVSLGITVTKAPDTSDVTFGAYITPAGIQIDNFALGLGVAYSATDKVESHNENWAVIMPFTYTLAI
jgi:hypothetical protein